MSTDDLTPRAETPAETMERLGWARAQRILLGLMQGSADGRSTVSGMSEALRAATVNEIHEQFGGGDLASLAERLEVLEGRLSDGLTSGGAFRLHIEQGLSDTDAIARQCARAIRGLRVAISDLDGKLSPAVERLTEVEDDVGGALARLDAVAGWQEGILARLGALEKIMPDVSALAQAVLLVNEASGDWVRRLARLETLAQWWLESDPEAPEAAKAAWNGAHEPPDAWLRLPASADLKACPRCGGVAMEGQHACADCGCEPTDDVTWRAAPEPPQTPAERRTGEPCGNVHLSYFCGLPAGHSGLHRSAPLDEDETSWLTPAAPALPVEGEVEAANAWPDGEGPEVAAVYEAFVEVRARWMTSRTEIVGYARDLLARLAQHRATPPVGESLRTPPGGVEELAAFESQVADEEEALAACQTDGREERAFRADAVKHRRIAELLRALPPEDEGRMLATVIADVLDGYDFEEMGPWETVSVEALRGDLVRAVYEWSRQGDHWRVEVDASAAHDVLTAAGAPDGTLFERATWLRDRALLPEPPTILQALPEMRPAVLSATLRLGSAKLRGTEHWGLSDPMLEAAIRLESPAPVGTAWTEEEERAVKDAVVFALRNSLVDGEVLRGWLARLERGEAP